jgi:uncharacterized protein (TIGR01777 family)
MQVVIAGGSGFLGRALVRSLDAAGHQVVVLTRRATAERAAMASASVRQVEWQPDGGVGAWARHVDEADAVINVTGAGIADRRWTQARRAELSASRLLPARSLVAALVRASPRGRLFIQGSAVGYYGTGPPDRTFDESSPAGSDYLARLCVAWEAEARPAAALDCRLVLLRTGVALAQGGGMLDRLRLPILLFAGGPVGGGRQMISWIHRDDWVAMVVWVLTGAVEGPLNACAPSPASNAELTRAFARSLHRPAWLPVPAPIIRLVFGEMGQSMLIEGQRVIPRRATDLGFTFRYPTVWQALGSGRPA